MSSKENQILNEIIVELVEENKALAERNANMQDEVDSLWAMMDEITASDIENFANILEDLEKDVLVKSLMVSKKKVLA